MNSNIPSVLNALIADEYFAFFGYHQLRAVMLGAGLKHAVDVFEEILKDELDDHFNKLVDYANSEGIEVFLSIDDMRGNANDPDITILDGVDTVGAVSTQIGAEQRAIRNYQLAADMVEDEDPALAKMLMDIKNEEREHLSKLMDLYSEITANDKSLDTRGYVPEWNDEEF